MTRLNNTNEGAPSTGTTISLANSGGASGDAWSSVVSTPTFSNVRAAHGTYSSLFASGATANYLMWNLTSTDLAVRGYFYFTALATADYTPVRINGTNSAGTANAGVCSVNLVGLAGSTNSRLRLLGASGANLGTFLTAIPINTWIRIELKATQSETAGTASVAYYVGDSTVPVETPISVTAVNMGIAAFSAVRFGKNATTGLDAHNGDTFAAETVAGGAFIGPAVSTSSAVLATIATSTGWTPTGGTVQAVLANPSDSDFITSSDTPTSVLFDGTFGPLSTPTGDFVVQVRMDKENASSGTAIAKIYDNTTLRATVSGIAIPDAVSTVNVTFLAANIGTVTSWSTGVRFTFEVTAA